MPQSNHGGSKPNNSTSKQTGDKQRSSHAQKGKTGQSHQGGQKGKEDMGKGKMSNQREGSDRSQSGSDDEE